MYVINVRKYKRKLLILLGSVILWIIVMVGADYIYDSTVHYTLSINSNISFSYPASLTVTNIYSRFPDASPYITASNSSHKSFIDFKSPEEGFEFKYPSVFKLDQQSFPGNEILYHIDFQNTQDKKYYGFVQVWNMPYPLEEFLESSKEASMNEFIEFTSEKIEVNGVKGYFWNYTIEAANGKHKNLEVFLSKGSKLYRISYYVPAKNYTKKDYDMFFEMVNSFKIN